jgi:hypothetical protein
MNPKDSTVITVDEIYGHKTNICPQSSADNTFLTNIKGFGFHSPQLCTIKQTNRENENL